MKVQVGVEFSELVKVLALLLDDLDASQYIKDGKLLVHNLIADLQENGDLQKNLCNQLKQK